MSQAGILKVPSAPPSSISITGDTGGTLTGNSFTITGGSTGLTFNGLGTTETVSGTLAVKNGGTGDSSLTAYAVLCGGTTSTNPVQSVASLGTSGQVLTSNGAGALPTFQPAGGGGSGALTLIQTQTAAAQTTLNFTTGISSTYTNYRLAISNLTFGGGGPTQLSASLSTDGGATWITTGYASGGNGIGLDIVNLSLTNPGQTTTTESINAFADINNMTSGAGYITSAGTFSGYDTANGPMISEFSGDVYETDSITANAFQVILDGIVTFSGTFSLYGYSK